MTSLDIYQSAHFRIVLCCDCDVPGYLIMMPRDEGSSFDVLPTATLLELGPTLALLERVVIQAVKARHVYIMRYSEASAAAHFHIFPCTVDLSELYAKESGSSVSAINGPLLFAWARARFAVNSPREISSTTLNMGDGIRQGLIGKSIVAKDN